MRGRQHPGDIELSLDAAVAEVNDWIAAVADSL